MRSQLAAMFLVFSLSANAQTLSGAIDMHAHADPDGVPRKMDAVDLARLAKERGMRAIVLKNHYEPTASLAYIVRKEVPGIEVFGGISLDLTVGGVNPAAVEWMTKVRGGYGRVIWLPTFDAEAQVKRTGQQRPFSPVVRAGKVTPELAQVIAIAARNNLVLETGHSSGSEDLVIIEEARRQGVQNVMVTHALTNPGGPLTLSEIQQGAKLVMDAGDILDDLQILLPETKPSPQAAARPLPPLSEDERRVYDAIEASETPIDEIATKSNLPSGTVSSTLLALELKRLVKQLPGKYFVKLA